MTDQIDSDSQNPLENTNALPFVAPYVVPTIQTAGSASWRGVELAT